MRVVNVRRCSGSTKPGSTELVAGSPALHAARERCWSSRAGKALARALGFVVAIARGNEKYYKNKKRKTQDRKRERSKKTLNKREKWKSVDLRRGDNNRVIEKGQL